LIDATEREHYRPKDREEQRALYSGKQGYHTIKNTVMSDPQKFVHYLGLTTQGSIHDLELLRIEFNPRYTAWFAPFDCIVDLGYLGFENDFYGEEVGALVIPISPTVLKEEILGFCAQKLPFHKAPKVVVFTDTLPVTSTGKYQRNKVKHLFAEWKSRQFRKDAT